VDVEIDISKTIIETDRLILRAWKETDLNDFFEYACIDGVGEMAGWKHHETLEESRIILSNFITEKNVFAIVYKNNDKVIGSLGLHDSWAINDPEYKDINLKEIGYVLSKNYWGRGLIPEAVKEVIKFCFDKLNIDALTIGHFSTNMQSKRVIEKCGFKFVKQSEHYAKQLQKNFDDMKYIIYR
jgi:ribosomal-protein-alanine N-acetyltransferase